MANGMTHPNYAAMTITQLTNAVAKLFLHTSPLAKAGKGWLNPFACATKTGECTGPDTCDNTPLMVAVQHATDPVVGDTADEAERRTWLRHIVERSNIVQWGGGNSMMFQHQRSMDYYQKAREYAALA